MYYVRKTLYFDAYMSILCVGVFLRALVIVLPCYGALEIVGVIIIIIIIIPFFFFM